MASVGQEFRCHQDVTILAAVLRLGPQLADSESGARITQSFVHSDMLLEHLYVGPPHGLGFLATRCWVLRAVVPRECENICVPRGRGCCLCAPISEVTQHHYCHVLFIRSESLSLTPPEGQGNRICLLKGRLSENLQACFQTAIVIQAGQGREDL